jgi:hypothetical protein
MKQTVFSILLASAALGGCASTQDEAARQALQDVRDAYAAGDYGGVIRTVATSSALAGAPRAERVEALKLQSFSYCVTDHIALCQDGFVRILRIQPSFALAPNEAGHPQWGPAFQRAQAAVGAG